MPRVAKVCNASLSSLRPIPPIFLPACPSPLHAFPPPPAATGLNYPAILDTAADVAKALLHLHFNDVLHGDLKVDRGGQKGKGKACVCMAGSLEVCGCVEQ